MTELNLTSLLAGTDDDTAWQDNGVCAQADPEAWFPEAGDNAAQARSVCGTCTARLDCLEYALRHDEKWGIWGGWPPRNRRRLLHRYRDDTSGATLLELALRQEAEDAAAARERADRLAAAHAEITARRVAEHKARQEAAAEQRERAA